MHNCLTFVDARFGFLFALPFIAFSFDNSVGFHKSDRGSSSQDNAITGIKKSWNFCFWNSLFNITISNSNYRTGIPKDNPVKQTNSQNEN